MFIISTDLISKGNIFTNEFGIGISFQKKYFLIIQINSVTRM